MIRIRLEGQTDTAGAAWAMVLGGGKSQTSTGVSTTTIPPQVLQEYSQVNQQAQNTATQPFQPYSGQFVAPINSTEQSGINQTQQYANAAQPYYQQASGEQQYANNIQGTALEYQNEANDITGQAQGYFSQANDIADSGLGYQQQGLAAEQGAAGLTLAGTAAANPTALTGQQINQYLSPYLGDVLGSTEALVNQQNQQQQAGQLGNAITSGAFGGDRTGIAAANLAQQEELAGANAYSTIANQGYNTALATAQQQQGLSLSAQQANLARLLQGGQQLSGIGTAAGQLGNNVTNVANTVGGLGQASTQLEGTVGQLGNNYAAIGNNVANIGNNIAGIGTASQQQGLAGAAQELTAGQLQQQTQQAQDTAQYNQFLQQQGYPFQVDQFLANIAEGTGSLSGSTTNSSSTQPAPFFSDERLKEDIEPIGKTFDGENIIKFRYKGSPQKHIGLLAQDVEKHHPEAVGLAGGYKTVDYDAATKEAAGLGAAKRYASGGYADGGGGLNPHQTWANQFNRNEAWAPLLNSQAVTANMHEHNPLVRAAKANFDKAHAVVNETRMALPYRETPQEHLDALAAAKTHLRQTENAARKARNSYADGGMPIGLGGGPADYEMLQQILQNARSIQGSSPGAQMMPNAGSTPYGGLRTLGSVLESGQGGGRHIASQSPELWQQGKPQTGLSQLNQLTGIANNGKSLGSDAGQAFDWLKGLGGPAQPAADPSTAGVYARGGYLSRDSGGEIDPYGDPESYVPSSSNDNIAERVAKFKAMQPKDPNHPAQSQSGLGQITSLLGAGKSVADIAPYAGAAATGIGSELASLMPFLTLATGGSARLHRDPGGSVLPTLQDDETGPQSPDGADALRALLAAKQAGENPMPPPRPANLGNLSQPDNGRQLTVHPRGLGDATDTAPAPMAAESNRYQGQTLENPAGIRDNSGAAVGGLGRAAAPQASSSSGQSLYSGLLQRGFGPVQAAALVGNMQTESGLNPSAQNPKEGAAGLIQWEGPRRDALNQFAQSQGKTPNDPNVQMDFIAHEMNTTEKGPGSAFMNAGDLATANKALHSYIRYGSDTEGQRLANATAYTGGNGHQNGQSSPNGIQVAQNDSPGGLGGIAKSITDAGNAGGDYVKANQNWLVPLLEGLGTMASSNSRYLGAAALQGLGGAARGYEDVQNQQLRRALEQPVLQSRNIGVSNELANGWLNYKATTGQEISLQDYAKMVGYSGPVGVGPQQSSPVSVTPTSSSRTPSQTPQLQPYSYNGKEMQTGTVNRNGVNIPLMGDPLYLQGFIAHNEGIQSPIIQGQVAAAKDALSRVQNSHQTYDVNGNLTQAPNAIAQGQTEANAAANVTRAQGFQNAATEFNKSAPSKRQALDDIQNAYLKLQAGPTAEARTMVARIANDFGIPVPNGSDPGEYDTALKSAAMLMAGQLQDMSGAAPSSEISLLKSFAAEPAKDPTALRNIITRSKAMLDYQDAVLNGYDPNKYGYDVNSYTKNFNQAHNYHDEFLEPNLKKTPWLAGEQPAQVSSLADVKDLPSGTPFIVPSGPLKGKKRYAP